MEKYKSKIYIADVIYLPVILSLAHILPMIIDLNKKFWQLAILLLLALIWGSSFILMKRGLETFSNMEVAAYRIFIAFLVLTPFSLINLRFLKSQYFLPLICSGILGNAIPAFLFTKAQTVISSSLSGMLNSMTPLLTLLVGAIFFNLRIHRMNVLGVIVGLIGALGLLLDENLSFVSNEIWYGMYVVLATLCYAISVNIIKKYLKDLNALVITSLALFTVGPACGIYLFVSDFFQSLAKDNAMINFGYITILGVIGTSAGVIIFNFLIKKTSPVFASSVTYIIPVVAIFWGILDMESVESSQFLWIIVILLGVYMVNWTKNKRF